MTDSSQANLSKVLPIDRLTATIQKI